MSEKRLGRRAFLRFAGGAAAGALLAACKPEVVVETVVKEVEKIVKETVIVEGEEKVVEKVVKETVIVEKEVESEARKVILTFLSEQPTIAEQDPLNTLLGRFEEQNPGVKIARLTTAAGDDYFTKLVTMTAAGTPPDIFYMPPWNLVYFKDEGLLAALDPYVAIRGAGLDISDVPDALVAAYSWGGVLLGLPVLGSIVRIWAYNKDAFDEAGVEYPTRYWAYDEFLQKATDAMSRVNEEVDVWGADPRLQDNAHLLPWLWTFGGDFYNYPDLNKCALTRPESIEAMQASVDLIRKYQIQAPPEIGPTDLGISFPAGKIAVSAIGTGQWIDPADPEKSAWPFRWGLIEQPKVRETHALIHSTGMSISAKSANRDLAWDLLAFLMSEESQIFYSQHTGKIAGLKSVGAQYAFANLPAEDLAVISDAMEYARGRVFWRTPVWGKNATAAQQLWQAMWLGEITAEEACRQACEEIDPVLQDALAAQ